MTAKEAPQNFNAQAGGTPTSYGAAPGQPGMQPGLQYQQPQPYQMQQQHMQVHQTVLTPQYIDPSQRPNDWLIPAAIAFFLMHPTGIFAIYFAIKSRESADRGDLEMANHYALNAKRLSIASYCLFGFVILAVIVYVAVIISISS